MIDVTTFQTRLEAQEEVLPLLTLDEFFDGNTEEDSIAPNQWEFGRPSLAKIWDMLRRLERMPNIAWVRVALHDDTEIEEDNGTALLHLAGDSIMICTNMESEELEKIVDCEWLCSDGVLELTPLQLDLYYSYIPQIPNHFKCFEIVWD